MSEQTETAPQPVQEATGVPSAPDEGDNWSDITEDGGATEGESGGPDDSAWGDVSEEEEQEASDDSDEDEEESSEGEDEDSDVEDSEGDEVETLEEVPEVAKVYKAKNKDGEVLEIPDNLVFKLKADGKFQEVTFKTLKDNYAGKVAWDQRFSELGEREKAVEAAANKQVEDREVVNTYVSEIMTNFKNADVPGAINALADLTGQDRAGMIRSMLGGMVKFYNELATLSPEQQERYILQQENNAYRTRLGREKQVSEQKKAQAEIANRLTKLKQEWQVSDAETQAQWAVIKQEIQNKTLFNGDMSQVTPELVIAKVLDNRITENIKTAALEAQVELTPEDSSLILNQLMAFVQTNGYKAVTEFEIDDYIDFVKAAAKEAKVIKGQAAKNLSRKAKKNGKATPKTVKREAPKSTPKNLEEAWDSL